MTTAAVLAAFCRVNDHAPIYLHRSAFGPYYILSDDRDPVYIGLPLGLEEFRDRFIFTDREMVIDRELTLFAEPPAVFDGMAASGRLQAILGQRLRPLTGGMTADIGEGEIKEVE